MTDDRAGSAVPDLDLIEAAARASFHSAVANDDDWFVGDRIIDLVLHARALRAEVAALTAERDRYKAALEEIGGWACANPDDLAARVFRLARAALAGQEG